MKRRGTWCKKNTHTHPQNKQTNKKQQQKNKIKTKTSNKTFSPLRLSEEAVGGRC